MLAWTLTGIRQSPRSRLLLAVTLAVFLSGFLYFPSTRAHSDFYYLFVLLPFLLLATRGDWRQLLGAPTIQLTALFLAYSLLTLTWRENATELGVYDPLRHALLIWSLVVVTAFVTASRPGWLIELAPALAVAAVFVTVASMALFYQDASFPHARLQNQVGLRDNPIGGAVPMGLIALAGLAALLAGGSAVRRLLGGLGAMAATIFILAAQSRSLLMGLIVGAIVLLAFHRNWRSIAFLLVSVALVSVAIEVLPGMRGLFERADSYRLMIWSEALRYIREAPWFGHGFSADLAFDMGHRYTDSSHNIWLTAWLHGGAVGFVLLAALVGWCGRTAWQVRHRPDAWLAVSLLFFALVFTFFNVHDIVARFAPHLTVSLWLAVGLLAGLEIRLHHGAARTPS